MALAQTTLTGPITASQLTFGVASTANQAFPAVGAAPLGYQPVQIDDEIMFLVSCPATNTITVRGRGSEGTDATSHDIAAAVLTSATPALDWPPVQPGMTTPRPPSNPDVLTIGQSGAIPLPTEIDTTILINATGVAVTTLAAPSIAMNGAKVTITSQTAQAHTVTATGLFNTGGTTPFSLATFPAKVGVSMTLEAQNGAWNVVGQSPVGPVFS